MSLATAISVLVLTGSAKTSHHFESDVPPLDLTDLYVFDAPGGEATVFVVNFNPSKGLHPDFNPFIEDAHYNVHVAFGEMASDEGLTLSLSYDAQSGVQLGLIDGHNEKIGKQGRTLAAGPVGEVIDGAEGVTLWTGVVADPFAGNSQGFRRMLGDIAEGRYDPSVFDEGEDLFGILNDGSIVIELPNAMLASNISVYATTEINENGAWRQVQRIANILTTHMFFGDDNPESPEHNHHRPEIDMAQRYAMSASVVRAVTLAGSQDKPVAYADRIAAELLPDVLRYEVGSKAHYGLERRNGRALGDDAMNVALSMFLGQPTDDNVDIDPKKSRDSFPYVIEAAGFR
ncbi:DUF4331 family protein [Roseovarius sp.]|uniref:DUF4331 family protein n=1 Tax=Roseovarius sp. TaxID=1486281 RepID=UPI00257C62B3|nr:DUF4331 family protein [Roseovarius sp.]